MAEEKNVEVQEQTPGKEKTETTQEKPGDDGGEEAEGKESPLDRAEKVNEEKAKLLEREEKLIARKEKLAAEEMVGGRSKAGGGVQEEVAPTDEEIADKFSRGELDILNPNG